MQKRQIETEGKLNDKILEQGEVGSEAMNMKAKGEKISDTASVSGTSRRSHLSKLPSRFSQDQEGLSTIKEHILDEANETNSS
jgi:hypothetical protein